MRRQNLTPYLIIIFFVVLAYAFFLRKKEAGPPSESQPLKAELFKSETEALYFATNLASKTLNEVQLRDDRNQLK